MSLPIVTLKNLFTAPVNIKDLNNLQLKLSASLVPIQELYTAQELANSADLQTEISAGKIELIFDGVLISDVSLLCQKKGGSTIWTNGFTLISAPANTSVTWKLDYVLVPYDCNIIRYAGCCNTGSSINAVQISSDNGTTWTTVINNINIGTTGTPTSTNVNVLQGSRLRVLRLGTSSAAVEGGCFDLLFQRV